MPPEQLRLFEQFVEIQKTELELRREDQTLKAKELDISAKQQDNSHEYSLAALQAHRGELRDDRQCYYDDRKRQYWLIGGLTAGVFIMLGAAFWAGATDQAIEFIKMCAMIGVPSLGAYAYGKSKSTPRSGDE